MIGVTFVGGPSVLRLNVFTRDNTGVVRVDVRLVLEGVGDKEMSVCPFRVCRINYRLGWYVRVFGDRVCVE